LIETMQNSSDRFIPRRCAESLRALNFKPQKDAIGALYWHYLFDDEKCAECGADFAIPLLLKSFVGLGDGWDVNERWRNTYFKLGDVGFMPFVTFFQQIYVEYKNFIRNITKLDFSLDSDKRKAAMIEYYSQLLKQSVKTISKYGNIQAFEYCVKFYKNLKCEVYSHTEVGFLDIFKAVTIRKNAVESFIAFPESLFEQIVVFLCDILENDPVTLYVGQQLTFFTKNILWKKCLKIRYYKTHYAKHLHLNQIILVVERNTFLRCLEIILYAILILDI